MRKKTRMAVASCPDCEWDINLGSRPREGQRVTCPDCGAELEVIGLEPPELDWVFDEFESDWGPDDEEEWG